MINDLRDFIEAWRKKADLNEIKVEVNRDLELSHMAKHQGAMAGKSEWSIIDRVNASFCKGHA